MNNVAVGKDKPMLWEHVLARHNPSAARNVRNYSNTTIHGSNVLLIGRAYNIQKDTDKKDIPCGAPIPSIMRVIASLPPSVGGTLCSHMDRLRCSVEELEERSQVSGTVIKKIRANNYSRLEFSYFIALCVGLTLEPPYSFDFINKTRYRLDNSLESIAYQKILTSLYPNGIDACNDFLLENNLPPLTRRLKSLSI